MNIKMKNWTKPKCPGIRDELSNITVHPWNRSKQMYNTVNRTKIYILLMKISGGKHYVSLDYLLCINNNKKKLYTHRKRPRQYVSQRLCFFCSKWGSCLLHVIEIIIFLTGALLLSTGYLVPPHLTVATFVFPLWLWMHEWTCLGVLSILEKCSLSICWIKVWINTTRNHESIWRPRWGVVHESQDWGFTYLGIHNVDISLLVKKTDWRKKNKEKKGLLSHHM